MTTLGRGVSSLLLIDPIADHLLESAASWITSTNEKDRALRFKRIDFAQILFSKLQPYHVRPSMQGVGARSLQYYSHCLPTSREITLARSGGPALSLGCPRVERSKRSDSLLIPDAWFVCPITTCQHRNEHA